MHFKKHRDFLGGPVIKNPPCNGKDEGLIPGYGTKIPHAVEQLSLPATAKKFICPQLNLDGAR